MADPKEPVARDSRRLAWTHDLVRDLHSSICLLRREPLFALTAALSIAIGIGVPWS